MTIPSVSIAGKGAKDATSNADIFSASGKGAQQGPAPAIPPAARQPPVVHNSFFEDLPKMGGRKQHQGKQGGKGGQASTSSGGGGTEAAVSGGTTAAGATGVTPAGKGALHESGKGVQSSGSPAASPHSLISGNGKPSQSPASAPPPLTSVPTKSAAASPRPPTPGQAQPFPFTPRPEKDAGDTPTPVAPSAPPASSSGGDAEAAAFNGDSELYDQARQQANMEAATECARRAGELTKVRWTHYKNECCNHYNQIYV